MNLNSSLFWDVDINTVDFEKNGQFIINRVLLRGSLKDWYELKAYYGLERIKNEVVKMRYLDQKTLSFCSAYFNIEKSNFRCYNTPQSTRELWDY